MKKILIPAILISLFIQGYGQTISGTVYDKFTRMELRGATVFFNGTSVASVTDLNGDFKLQLPGDQNLPIVAYFPGYENLFLLEYPKNAHIHFFVDSKIYALGTQFSSGKKSDRNSRKLNEEIFREQFLGTSVNGRSCRIINERDLVFKYNTRTGLLSAYSGKPLLIVNMSLGYRLQYYLEKFEFSKDGQVQCKGFSQFIEKSYLDPKDKESIEKKRELAYFGSWMEFFRSLWNNSLDSAGYELRNSANKKLTYDSIVLESNGAKYWRYKEPVTVYHFSRNRSSTIQTNDTVYFDRLGYFDTQGVEWKRSGEMTFQRLGDQLPYDYKIDRIKK